MTNERENKVEHITPQEDSLNSIQTNILCDIEGCNRTFKSLPVLKFHQSQYHNHQRPSKKMKTSHIEERFHCPVKDCIYYYNSGTHSRHFAKLRYLKQHYLKVHSTCSFPCSLCGKSFSTTSLLRVHQQYCDLDLKCSCGQTFAVVTALQTHVRRMGHEAEILNVYARRLNANKIMKIRESSTTMTNTPIVSVQPKKGTGSLATGTSPILPKSQPPHLIAAIALSELAFAGLKRVSTVEVGVQTESSSAPRRLSRKSSSPSCSRDMHQNHKRKQTTEMETQTQLTNLKGKIRKRGVKKVSDRSSMASMSVYSNPVHPSQPKQINITQSDILSCTGNTLASSNPSYIVYEPPLEESHQQTTIKDDLFCSQGLAQEQVNNSGTQTTTSGVSFQVISPSGECLMPCEFYQQHPREGNDNDLTCSNDNHFSRREISIQADDENYNEGSMLNLDDDDDENKTSASNRYGLLYEEEMCPSGTQTQNSVFPSVFSRRPPTLASSQIRSSSIETQTDHDVFLSTHVLQQTGDDDIENDIILTSTETQTEREGAASTADRNSPSLWCTSETQTYENFSDIEPFLCSTIHTQTVVCGDHSTSSELFPELGHFTDTQTQTGMEEGPSVVTTHTQTPILGLGAHWSSVEYKTMSGS